MSTAQQQDDIGFFNFLFGRVAKSWATLQDQYLLANFPKKRFSADVWSRRWVYQLYKRMQMIWKYRCDIVHQKDGKGVSRRQRKILRNDIELQYQLGPNGLRAKEKDFLLKPIASVLHSSIRNQRYWICTMKSSRSFMTDYENNMFSGMRNVMRRWASVPI